jgi:hypothetical protein
MVSKNVKGIGRNLIKVRWLLGRDLNSEFPECKADVPTTPSPYYVTYFNQSVVNYVLLATSRIRFPRKWLMGACARNGFKDKILLLMVKCLFPDSDLNCLRRLYEKGRGF